MKGIGRIVKKENEMFRHGLTVIGISIVMYGILVMVNRMYVRMYSRKEGMKNKEEKDNAVKFGKFLEAAKKEFKKELKFQKGFQKDMGLISSENKEKMKGLAAVIEEEGELRILDIFVQGLKENPDKYDRKKTPLVFKLDDHAKKAYEEMKIQKEMASATKRYIENMGDDSNEDEEDSNEDEEDGGKSGMLGVGMLGL